MSEEMDKLFFETFNKYYDAHFFEIQAGMIVQRWTWVDSIVSVLVALMASTSAVASWAVWNKPGISWFWIGVSSLAALAAIVHAALKVPGQIKDWEEIRTFFLILRNDLQILRQRMSFVKDLDPDVALKDFEVLQKRFGEGETKIKADLLLTKGLRKEAQRRLNQLIEREKNRKEEL